MANRVRIEIGDLVSPVRTDAYRIVVDIEWTPDGDRICRTIKRGATSKRALTKDYLESELEIVDKIKWWNT